MLIYVFERTEDEIKKLLIDGKGLQMGTKAGKEFIEDQRREKKIIMEELRNANMDINRDQFLEGNRSIRNSSIRHSKASDLMGMTYAEK